MAGWRRHGDPHGRRPPAFSSGSGEKPTPEQLEQMNKAMVRSSQTEASRLMLGWFAMAHPSINAQYTYAGEAESPDGKAYVIDVKNADSFAARLFIDEQTHLPLMVTYKAAAAADDDAVGERRRTAGHADGRRRRTPSR